MAKTMKKMTKLMVATGIMICVLGLAFIAMSGSSALSDGYGNNLTLSSLTGANAGHCVAIKGSHGCVAKKTLIF